jgi:hypothetical protein
MFGRWLHSRATQSTAGEIVERVATFFKERLWESDAGAKVRSRLERAGVDEPTMREFGYPRRFRWRMSSPTSPGAYPTICVSRISARRRAQSHERRMRRPWARGSGEVYPRGWTYHRLEEILMGAALVSALVCVVLWMTIGGFLG